MDITQIVRVGYGYYPNPTCIKNKKIKNKTINLSHRHSHSLCLSSVLTYSWSLSLSPVSANPHHHSLSLSLSLSPHRFVLWEGSVSHIYMHLLVLASIWHLILVPRSLRINLAFLPLSFLK